MPELHATQDTVIGHGHHFVVNRGKLLALALQERTCCSMCPKAAQLVRVAFRCCPRLT